MMTAPPAYQELAPATGWPASGARGELRQFNDCLPEYRYIVARINPVSVVGDRCKFFGLAL
jgi:hypothetical protein